MHARRPASLSPDDASPYRRNNFEDVLLSLRTRAPPSLSVPPSKIDRNININALDSYPNPSGASSAISNVSREPSISSARSSPTAATSPVSSRRSSWQAPSSTGRFELRNFKRASTPITFVSTQQRLPTGVLVCILQQLREIHESSNSLSCSSCFNRDAFNLALVSRAWDKAVRRELYVQIHLDGVDAPSQLKRHKLSCGVRLKLLRRTLRDRRALAQTVRELRVSNPLPDGSLSLQIIDQVASVVMVCPNLEVLGGFHPPYNHTFSRLYHALAGRKNLRQHIWIIGENEEITDRSTWQLPPGLMDLEQTSMFLGLHTSWHELTTLVVHAQPGAILEHNVFTSIFRLLPSLTDLSISSFDVDDFHDTTLLSLRPLTSLRLANLSGVSSKGLSSLASSSQQSSLKSLSLISVPVTSLLVISKLLSHLPITRFTLSQPQIPTLPSDTVVIPPLLASIHLAYLHWDIQTPPPLDTATPHLAASIFHGAFPALCTIRAPSESGTLQSLCTPRAQIALPSDKFSSLQAYSTPSTSGSGSINGTSRPGSRSSRSSMQLQPHNNILRHSRVRAQARLDAARKHVGVRVIVEDEQGRVTKDVSFPGWVGRVGSKIQYVLDSDIGSAERALAEEGDLLGDVLGATAKSEGGCAGLWNAGHSGGRKWFAHPERARWKGVEVEKLF